MALVGGGGAGNIAGSNPSGTGSSLFYIGEHCGAYSGTFVQSTSFQTMLDFETGPQYIVGTLTCAGAVEIATPQSGGTTGFQLKINDQVVWLADTETNENDQPGTVTVKLLLAPYSHVNLVNISNVGDTNELTTAVFTGRVY
jgi:hypothetical protein